MWSFFPFPLINPTIIESYPFIATLDYWIVMASFWSSNMDDESFQLVYDVLCWLRIKILRKVDLMRKFNRVFKFNFIHCDNIEDQALKMYEKIRWQWMKSMIFMNCFHLALTIITKVITNYFRLHIFIYTIFQIWLIFYLHR